MVNVILIHFRFFYRSFFLILFVRSYVKLLIFSAEIYDRIMIFKRLPKSIQYKNYYVYPTVSHAIKTYKYIFCKSFVTFCYSSILCFFSFSVFMTAELKLVFLSVHLFVNLKYVSIPPDVSKSNKK